MAHRLVKAGFSSLDVADLGAPTVRNMIDNFGFTLAIHDEIAMVSAPEAVVTKEIIPMPGVQFVQGPGTPGFAPIDRLIVPGNIPNMTNVPQLIRNAIDAWFGNPTAFQQEGPLALPPSSPTPGLFPPGGLQGPLPTGGVRTGGRAPFIVMPNGLPGCPTGYHPEKSGQPYCVRNRRMNPLNPRALSRATRRVGGFARAVKRARTLKKICRTL